MNTYGLSQDKQSYGLGSDSQNQTFGQENNNSTQWGLNNTPLAQNNNNTLSGNLLTFILLFVSLCSLSGGMFYKIGICKAL